MTRRTRILLAAYVFGMAGLDLVRPAGAVAATPQRCGYCYGSIGECNAAYAESGCFPPRWWVCETGNFCCSAGEVYGYCDYES